MTTLVIYDIHDDEQRGRLREHLREYVEAIRRILAEERLPAKVAEQKCGYCEVKRYCV